MADLQRGERIKELREARHLTQPAVADAIGVTPRAYQKYEAGGGIKWDNAKALAKFFRVAPDYLMSGPKSETPDLSLNGDGSQLDRLETQGARIESKLDQLIARLPVEEPDEVPAGLPDPEPPPETVPPSVPKPTRPGTRRAGQTRKTA